MTTIPKNRPRIEIWKHSGIKALEDRVEYAAVHVRAAELVDLSMVTKRPVKLIANSFAVIIEDPLAEPQQITFTTSPRWEPFVVGLWDEIMQPEGWYNTEVPMTWRQYAAQQLGQVLRQRDLAQRLSDFGIPRTQEEYLLPKQSGNAVERSLTLNYDELDKLLRAAGF